MKSDIQQMIETAFELEGLLLLADKRGDNTPVEVLTSIKGKVERLRTLIGYRLSASGTECGDEAIGVTGLELFEAVSLAEPGALESGQAAETADGNPKSESLGSEDDLEEISLMMGDGQEEKQPEQEASADSPADPAPEESIVEVDAEPATDGSENADTPEDEPMRLDEKLQRNLSKDLRAAFSLNDMFRFRRELFGNNAAEMTDAIHLVEAMQSYAEAEDYFYGDLGWDKESEEVKEFMTIIRNHFS